jgi:hypothetical protein
MSGVDARVNDVDVNIVSLVARVVRAVERKTLLVDAI